jgi:hypothetical protein
MPWKLKMLDSFRFLTIFAAALAAWIVFMWLTLTAVSASEHRPSERATVPAAPAPDLGDPPLPISALGARWLPNAAHAREGGAA